MKRSPFIVFGTAAGLVGVFSFHSSPVKISLGSISTTPSTSASTTTTRPGTSSAPTTTTTTPVHNNQPVSSTTTPPPVSSTTTTPPVTTTTVTTGVRNATGVSVNYYFGILSVKVTVTNTKITKVAIGAINDGGNSRSVSVDQYSIPILEKEALQAQSANIQSVSGASYTSAGFAQSLQSALSKLGL